jgi:hypothetical protein
MNQENNQLILVDSKFEKSQGKCSFYLLKKS